MRRWDLSGSERIEEEYRKVDRRWMYIHYRMLLLATCLAAVAEMGMFLVLRQVGPSYKGALDYWLRFVAVPIGGNLLLVLIGEWFMRSSRFSQHQKMWAASLLTSLMVLWIYTIHMFYPAMSLIFCVPALLAMAYGFKRLVAVVGALCFGEKILADFFLNGWSGRASPLEDSSVLIDFIMAVVLLSFFFCLAWFITGIESSKNDAGIALERERHLYKMRSITDALTQVGNRLALEETLQALSQKDMLPRMHAVILDMDNFKHLNDTYGHACGDDCLRALGRSIRTIDSETVEGFRMGGDEFCLLFCDMETDQVLAVCQSLQEDFHAAIFQTNYAHVRLSMGVARARPGENSSELLSHADSALYEAKRTRDAVCLYDPEEDEPL